MYTTEQLIEKYKAEMQKMISDSKPPEPKPTPTPTPTPTPEPSLEVKEAASEKFPQFVPDSEKLNQRIEEILAENSDVSTDADRPANLLARPYEQNTQQGDLILEGDELVSEYSNSQQSAPDPKPIMRPPAFTPQNPPMRPLNPQPQAPQSASQPPEQSTEQTETMQEMVSRTCIRGGQKAQYSPPANTGLALGVNTQQTPPLTDSGTLRIETFAANRAIPIGGAVIRVKNEENNRLVAVFVTDSSGNTQSFTLPTPDRALSETPDAVHPFVNYLVDINAEGFVPQTNLPVQMFGGTQSYLPANLIPLNT